MREAQAKKRVPRLGEVHPVFVRQCRSSNSQIYHHNVIGVQAGYGFAHHIGYIACYALVDVEGCEEDVDDAVLTNAKAPEFVANLCTEHDVVMVYISTGGVFDGTKEGYYTEEDQPSDHGIRSNKV